MRKLILHIGRHKTGTTAIQHFLRDNREILRQEGFYLPETGVINVGHHGLVRPLLPKNLKEGRPADFRELPNYKKLSRELDAVSSGETVLLTSEAFQNCKPSVVREAFADYDVQIIVFLRNHLEYLASAYVQRVQATDYADSLAEFYRDFHRHAVSYFSFLEAWSESFSGQLSVKLYRPGGAVEDFLDIVLPHSNASFIRRKSHSNPSINQTIAAFKRELNRRDLADKPTQEEMYFVLPDLNERFPAPAYAVPEDIKQQLIDDAAPSDRKTADKYFGGEQMFDYSQYATAPEPALNEDEFQRILAELRAEIQQRRDATPQS